MTQPSFTGRRRQRKTKLSVRIADAVAHTLITMGGMGTIFAVSLVCVYLVWVAAPLFFSSSIERADGFSTAAAADDVIAPAYIAVDEHRLLGLSYSNDGTLSVFRLDTGELLDHSRIFEDKTPSAFEINARDGDAIFGFEDGSVSIGQLRFRTDFLSDVEIPTEIGELEIGDVVSHAGGVIKLTTERQHRRHSVSIDMEPPVQLGDTRILHVDLSMRPTGPIFASISEGGAMHVGTVQRRRNLMTGETTLTLSGGEAEIPERPEAGLPFRVLITGIGDSVMVVWRDGHLIRYDTRNRQQPVIAEEVSLLSPGDEITAMRFLIGKTTLVVGDSGGGLHTWFRVRLDDAETSDGLVLVRAHELADAESPVTALAVSARKRMLAAGYADGLVRLFHITSDQLVAEDRIVEVSDGVTALAIAPRDDTLFATTTQEFLRWEINAPHPETTFRSLFKPVWYEGYPEPRHIWQSSSGTDDFEPKLGLIPLIFGTIKATFYSMLFGAPLALLAAVYSSEFLSPRLKGRIKPTIEMMASLPSVVLGFLAALVFAPFIEDVVPHTLTAFFTVPFVVILGAYLWQLLPRNTAARFESLRFPLIIAALPIGIALAALLGPIVENIFYAGDIKAWLDGQKGGATGGWLLMMLPLSALAVAFAMSRMVNPRLKALSRDWSDRAVAVADLCKFLLGAAAALGLAVMIGWLFGGVGFDARGGFVDTYAQRNALVVGFVMGFAIIPIIYTISEDALSSVPEHLRAASLGAGATRWQTATRIIIPTAMSGLFSAVMIGFGRAVGETMIVLMAAGNTPVMEWNIFNGFRTLSANIAVELPEAVVNSTHYRTLFLAAFTLFAMTFAVNTVAELVRQRFRRRAYTL
ncbi:MAG: ABC transporter permease subunit [Phycisphaeraceae bacterium]|nr:MAG: ABC transporter permease subunit [Phycisphaeraceae bacterium]